MTIASDKDVQEFLAEQNNLDLAAEEEMSVRIDKEEMDEVAVDENEGHGQLAEFNPLSDLEKDKVPYSYSQVTAVTSQCALTQRIQQMD